MILKAVVGSLLFGLIGVWVGSGFFFGQYTSIVQNSTSIEEDIVLKQSPVPLKKWGDVVAFGDKGEVVIAGVATIMLSVDSGKSWSLLTGGKGYKSISKDGGITFSSFGENAEEKSSTIEWVDSKQVCSVEWARIISQSKRIYIRATCEHTAQLWSVPYGGEADWYVTNFVPSDQKSTVLAPDSTFESAGGRILIRTLFPNGAAILTTDDNGKNWRPFWQKSALDYGVTDFSFIDERNGWILKGNGEVVHTKDAGISWARISLLPSDKKAYSISFVDEDTGYVVGKNGLIFVTKNSGKTWEDHSRYESVDWYKVIADKKGVWISGNSDSILGTMDGSKTWLKGTLPNKISVYSRLTVKDGVVYVAHNQTIFSSESQNDNKLLEGRE